MSKKLKSKILVTAACLSALSAQSIEAQADGSTNLFPINTEIGVKSNLLYDLNSTINLGVEFPVARKWSVDISGNYNPWTMSENRKWKHWLVQPELRYWTGERQYGHFFGLHLLGGEFNLNKVTFPFDMYPDVTNRRYAGWGAGAGLAYGYRWNFSQRWGMEAEIGVGAVYADWNKYCPINCGLRRGDGTGVYVTPTKLALNVIYRFGKPGKKRKVVDADYIYAPPVVKPDTVYINRTDTVYISNVASETNATVNAKSEFFHLSFPWSSAEVSEKFNGNQEQSKALYDLISQICGNKAINVKSINISGYASPEGSFQLNKQLSRQRAQNMADIITRECPAMASKIKVEGLGEDWDGLYKLLPEMPNAKYRRAVERLYETTTVNGGREKDLMNLFGGRPYFWLEKNIFPRLRRIELDVEFEKVKQ